jgi:hypothetical protein
MGYIDWLWLKSLMLVITPTLQPSGIASVYMKTLPVMKGTTITVTTIHFHEYYITNKADLCN